MFDSAFLGSASACSCVSGLTCVRSTLLLCSQPFATVCNRPPFASYVRGAMAVTLTFGGFKRRVTSFHVAGVVPCDIPACIITRGVFSDRRNTCARFFSEDYCIFMLRCS